MTEAPFLDVNLTDPGAVFNRQALLDIADYPAVSLPIRLHMYAVERSDSEGVAVFERGELAELLETPRSHLYRMIRRKNRHRFRKGCSQERLVLNLDSLRPVPLPLPGTGIGSSEITGCVCEERLAARCIDRLGVWMERHHQYGLAAHICPRWRRAD